MVTYTITQSVGATALTLAAAISTALASSAVMGLEALGVIADWNLNGIMGGPAGGTGGLYSVGSGLACGAGVVKGVLDRSGFPANSSGGVLVVPVVSALGGAGVMPGSPTALSAYISTPTMLVCSSCLSWSAPATPACTSVAHRYSGASAVNSTVSYNTISATALTVPDAGASALLPLAASRLTSGTLPAMQARPVSHCCCMCMLLR